MKAHLAAAETLWKQGDHDGAWLELEELEPIDRTMPEVIDLRLRILTFTCRWGLGDDLASVLQFAGEDEEGAQRYRNHLGSGSLPAFPIGLHLLMLPIGHDFLASAIFSTLFRPLHRIRIFKARVGSVDTVRGEGEVDEDVDDEGARGHENQGQTQLPRGDRGPDRLATTRWYLKCRRFCLPDNDPPTFANRAAWPWYFRFIYFSLKQPSDVCE